MVCGRLKWGRHHRGSVSPQKKDPAESEGQSFGKEGTHNEGSVCFGSRVRLYDIPTSLRQEARRLKRLKTIAILGFQVSIRKPKHDGFAGRNVALTPRAKSIRDFFCVSVFHIFYFSFHGANASPVRRKKRGEALHPLPLDAFVSRNTTKMMSSGPPLSVSRDSQPQGHSGVAPEDDFVSQAVTEHLKHAAESREREAARIAECLHDWRTLRLTQQQPPRPSVTTSRPASEPSPSVVVVVGGVAEPFADSSSSSATAAVVDYGDVPRSSGAAAATVDEVQALRERVASCEAHIAQLTRYNAALSTILLSLVSAPPPPTRHNDLGDRGLSGTVSPIAARKCLELIANAAGAPPW